MIDRMLYRRHLADDSVYDADDTGGAAGAGFQYVGGGKD